MLKQKNRLILLKVQYLNITARLVHVLYSYIYLNLIGNKLTAEGCGFVRGFFSSSFFSSRMIN